MLEQSNVSAFQINRPESRHQTEGDALISNERIIILNYIVWTILGQTVVVFGVISNVVNMICFVKQGFKDSINVSLTGLAISDLGCLLPLIWTNICYTPAFSDLDLPFYPIELQYMTTGVTHVMFTRISSWMTAAITLERCLCVVVPLKVKEIATPRRMFIVSASIFIVLVACASPQYVFHRLASKYYPDKNKTLLGIDFTEDLLKFEKFSYPINFFVVPVIAFVIIAVCTAILVTELKSKSKWRQKSAASEEAIKMTSSNQKVVKMVVMISTLFICCFVPACMVCVAVVIIPGFSIDGKYRNVAIAAVGIGFLLESINSSANIFIYYYMSSKYRDIFHQTIFKRNGL